MKLFYAEANVQDLRIKSVTHCAVL